VRDAGGDVGGVPAGQAVLDTVDLGDGGALLEDAASERAGGVTERGRTSSNWAEIGRAGIGRHRVRRVVVEGEMMGTQPTA
jgi:hypothetical protein